MILYSIHIYSVVSIYNIRWYRRDFIIEKQSPLQVSHYWFEVRLPYHVWFRSLNYEKSIWNIYKGMGGKKARCCIRQNYAAIDILYI